MTKQKENLEKKLQKTGIGKNGTGNKAARIFEIVCLVILALYPLRHIHWGLDFWDTGYNYANFEYMGFEHMDPMWLFSTYLANVVGNFLTKLPFAGGLVGMNFYTGLFVSVLAVVGYWFCTRKLAIQPWIAFVGEFVAISLCWCPTALLYNYLTYVLFLLCVILLYQGLTKEKKWYLFWAGICLGSNVLVRFANLAEAAMIVAVWAYGFIEFLEARKAGKSDKAGRRTFERTLWCLGGYLTALLVLLGYISVRYGLDAYIQGIQRLFAMTDNATDYKPTSMLTGLIYTYVENLYWAVRIGIIVVAGMVMFAGVRFLLGSIKKENRVVDILLRIVWSAVCIAMLFWLYYRKFCSFEFRTYDSMLRPGILFLMLSVGIGVIRIFHKNASKEEKLISGMLILVILLTSIGSNNGVYPSLNNLFVAAPYTLWQSYRFIRYVGDKTIGKIAICSFPAKGVLVAFLLLFLFQIGVFGVNFVFAEATGARQVTTEVENNKVLEGVKMHPDRARWMTELTAHVEANNLKDNDVILYGKIPALSYYLEMPSAFNPWSDLDSYSYETMVQDMEEVALQMKEDNGYRPVVILEDKYADYLEGSLQETDSASALEMEQDKKWQLIISFLQENGYEQTFRNEKFGMWEEADAK